MADLTQEQADFARDEGYEGIARLFEGLLYGGVKDHGWGLLPDNGKDGRMIREPDKDLESQAKIYVVNGMMALIAQVYLENGRSSAEAMVDFATMLHHVGTNWSGPDDGAKPRNFQILQGGKSSG